MAQEVRNAIRLLIEGSTVSMHKRVGIAEFETKRARRSFNELLKAAN